MIKFKVFVDEAQLQLNQLAASLSGPLNINENEIPSITAGNISFENIANIMLSAENPSVTPPLLPSSLKDILVTTSFVAGDLAAPIGSTASIQVFLQLGNYSATATIELTRVLTPTQLAAVELQTLLNNKTATLTMDEYQTL